MEVGTQRASLSSGSAFLKPIWTWYSCIPFLLPRPYLLSRTEQCRHTSISFKPLIFLLVPISDLKDFCCMLSANRLSCLKYTIACDNAKHNSPESVNCKETKLFWISCWIHDLNPINHRLKSHAQIIYGLVTPSYKSDMEKLHRTFLLL